MLLMYFVFKSAKKKQQDGRFSPVTCFADQMGGNGGHFIWLTLPKEDKITMRGRNSLSFPLGLAGRQFLILFSGGWGEENIVFPKSLVFSSDWFSNKSCWWFGLPSLSWNWLEHWKKNGVIWPKKLSHWYLRIFESNGLSSQIDSNILQLLGIPGWILVPRVSQLFRSNNSIFLSVNFRGDIESFLDTESHSEIRNPFQKIEITKIK